VFIEEAFELPVLVLFDEEEFKLLVFVMFDEPQPAKTKTLMIDKFN
jgi:hypothetical protein